MPTRRKKPRPKALQCEIDGVKFTGTWWVDGNVVTVRYGGHGASAPVETSPEATAHSLLCQLAKDKVDRQSPS